MARTPKNIDSLPKLLDQSKRPIYAINSRRRVVYCNPALAKWLQLEPARIVGRLVEYHSEPAADAGKTVALAPLVDLCPPPRALAGEACTGTISCVAPGGRLAHRLAEFVPLDAAGKGADATDVEQNCDVLVFLSGSDLSPEELSAEVSADQPADHLHRTIRRFRRSQASRYAIESLLGESSAMKKVRTQIAAAAASGANTLIVGHPGAGRAHVARAIHYNDEGAGETAGKLVPVDCELATEELLRRALDAVRDTFDQPGQRPTLLLENIDALDPAHQAQVLSAIRHDAFRARVIATCNRRPAIEKIEPLPERGSTALGNGHDVEAASARDLPARIDPLLIDMISTITISVPRLRERLEDLPILAQCFLEGCNRGSGKQIGSLRADVLDKLALYNWPGELDELREVVAMAHEACTVHAIMPGDLPAVMHHASQSASRAPRRTERIVLDELLLEIERGAIVRALAQTGGNKTEAAELLGMTRPRLYRRLVQLGLAGESPESESQLPEFIERSASDEAP